MPTIDEFQEALERVMAAEPPAKPACELSPDSNDLTTVFAGMRHNKEIERSLESLTPKQRAAYERWKSPTTPT